MLDSAAPNYGEVKCAVLRAVRSGAVDGPITATYGAVLVDEYQDCGTLQHELVVELSGRLPVRVFGDPMQAIFGFDGPVVGWGQVQEAFPPLEPLATPWRWRKVGCGELGEWLLEARSGLERGEPIDLAAAPNGFVRWRERRDGGHPEAAAAVRSVRLSGDERLLVIGHTTRAATRHELARHAQGVNIVERADLPDLVVFARRLARAGDDAADGLELGLTFATELMTQVEAPQLKRRLESLRNNRATKPAQAHEQACLDLLASPSPAKLAVLFRSLSEKQGANVFRREMFNAVTEALALCRTFAELPNKAVTVRDRRRFSAKHLPKRALGTTLLLKGLECRRKGGGRRQGRGQHGRIRGRRLQNQQGQRWPNQ